MFHKWNKKMLIICQKDMMSLSKEILVIENCQFKNLISKILWKSQTKKITKIYLKK